MDGLLFLDKPLGKTSRAIDNQIQKLFSTKKVGHLGTLDPFATGLLILALGKATKYLPYLEDGDKTYQAELKLGYSSSTGDLDGEISGDGSYPNLDTITIKKALKGLIGKQMQIPPMTSAIKIDGTPLYKLAHQGKEVERKAREVEVYEATLLGYQDGVVSFEVKVSKGTYIRTLGESLAKALHTTGYLISLRRTKVGFLKVEDAKTIEELSINDLKNPLTAVALPRKEISEKEMTLAKNGVKLSFPMLEEEKILLTHEGQGIAVYNRKENDIYVSERGLF